MSIRRSLFSFSLAVSAVVVACGSNSQSPGGGGDSGMGLSDGSCCGDDGSVGDAGGPGDGSPHDSAGSTVVDVGPPPEAGPPPMTAPTCSLPIKAADVSMPTTVIGNGLASSCTTDKLLAAVAMGGTITFSCGLGVTFALTVPLELRTDKDTVIDGGGKVSIDGQSMTRVLEFNGPNFRTTRTTVTLQNLNIVHGKRTGTALPMAPAPCSQGTAIDGGGAGIFVHDGILHVINVSFSNNQAAPSGPDVAGGAIYAEGSLDVTVVGSTFLSNSASNGGAIGSLNSDLTLVNDSFQENQATGSGANSVDASKCSVDGGQVGSGGNGGAVAIDGGSDGTVTICGCVFSQKNSAGAFGGALSRTADNAMQAVNIDQTTFGGPAMTDGNTAVSGGGAMYIHNCKLGITASSFANNFTPLNPNSPAAGGAIQADATTIDFVNDTFQHNQAMTGLGGALALFSNGGTIQSCTFAENNAGGGPGYFGGAIAGGQTLTINDTIFWNNTAVDVTQGDQCAIGSASTGQADLQYPMDRQGIINANDVPCVMGATTFSDALLGGYAGHGGPTSTRVPAAGSPAIGAGKACPATDQRGVPRMQPDGCTIGAVEAQ